MRQLASLRGDLRQFATKCLKIRTKAGSFEPLILNRAQLAVDVLLERQLAEINMVRALILKGRQQGISTYIAARFYHKTSMHRGRNTYILTHEQRATDTLFGMVDRYQRSNPLAPHVGTSNAKELEFDRLDSSYAVATAGAKAGGRSKALYYFHGSEVAFWANAGDHFAASVQGVPMEPGTEVILESTSAGASGEFYERCQDAEAGRGDYQMIFLPWWFSDEYARDPDPGFVLSREELDGEMSEEEYADTFGLSLRQMAWRRAKIYELRDPLLFRREYPATAQDAWTAPPGHEPYIGALLVLRARKRKSVEGIGPLVIGVDPASGGGDRFAACGRRGLRVEMLQHRNKLNHEEGVAWCRDMIDRLKPARMNIDAGNIGANIVTSLKNLGPHYAAIVRAVNFGGTSEWRNAKPKTPGPWNRRAEMYQRGKEWLELPEGTSIPDDGALQSDICAAKQKPRLDGFWLLESKEEMKKRGVRSPDLSDSWALTFAFNEYLQHYHQPAKVVGYGNVDANEHQQHFDSAYDDGYGGGDGMYGWMG
jgi:hypothetical protein